MRSTAAPYGRGSERTKRPRTPALVLAGRAGGRLGLLTEHRATSAVPLGGTHRLIDVAPSCCSHVGMADVWVSEQHNPASLADHLSNGRPWDLDRSRGGLLVLHPARAPSGRAGRVTGFADEPDGESDRRRATSPPVASCRPTRAERRS